MTGSGNEEAPHPTSGVDHAAAFADIRRELSDLDSSIGALRDEADRLLESASGRTALALLDPPATPKMTDLESSLDAVGRHAANIPDEFDPAPYDPEECDDSDETPGAFDELATAPAFGAAFDMDPKLPPVDVEVKRRSLLEEAPEPPALGEFGSVAGDEGEDPALGRTVVNFAPRATASDDEAETAPPPVFKEVVVDGPAFGKASSDETPAPAGQDGPDEEAFDKFFSSDVEPEPAQRWLLNE